MVSLVLKSSTGHQNIRVSKACNDYWITDYFLKFWTLWKNRKVQYFVMFVSDMLILVKEIKWYRYDWRHLCSPP